MNFLFDKSSPQHISADNICNYFGTKKSTAGNKANDIRNLLNLKLGNKEFSAESISGLNLSNVKNLNQIKTVRGASRRSRLNDIKELKRQLDL